MNKYEGCNEAVCTVEHVTSYTARSLGKRRRTRNRECNVAEKHGRDNAVKRERLYGFLIRSFISAVCVSLVVVINIFAPASVKSAVKRALFFDVFSAEVGSSTLSDLFDKDNAEDKDNTEGNDSGEGKEVTAKSHARATEILIASDVCDNFALSFNLQYADSTVVYE